MANAARGEVTLRLGGESYVLRPSFGAICEIEDALGANLFELGRKLERAEIAAKELVDFAHACLAHACVAPPGQDVSRARLGELILAEGALEVIAALVKFCHAYALGGPAEKKPGAAPEAGRSATERTTPAPT